MPAEDRDGLIIVVKPNSAEGGATVDVRQYGFEKAEFPQQSTADQWYDEAQFESYRRLGALSTAELFRAIGAGEGATFRDPAECFERLEKLHRSSNA